MTSVKVLCDLHGWQTVTEEVAFGPCELWCQKCQVQRKATQHADDATQVRVTKSRGKW